MIVIVIIVVIDIIIFLSSILPLSSSLLKHLSHFFIGKCPLTFSFPYFALPQKQEHLVVGKQESILIYVFIDKKVTSSLLLRHEMYWVEIR